MGWRGAGGNGAAGMLVIATALTYAFTCIEVILTNIDGSGTYYFFGGLLQLLGGFLEWVLGNTFPSVVFCTFGAFFLSFAATLSPSFAAFSTYAPVGADGSEGLVTQGFNASFGKTKYYKFWQT